MMQLGGTSLVLIAARGEVIVEGDNQRVGPVTYNAGGEVRAYERGEETFSRALIRTQSSIPEGGSGRSQKKLCWDRMARPKTGSTDTWPIGSGGSHFSQYIGLWGG